MAVKRRQPTFAEIVDDVRSEPSTPPSGRHAIRPGQLNKAGEFFDLAGRPLHLEGRVTAEAAEKLIVNHAALVAYEGCGCGGWSHCRPSWASPAQVTALAVTRDLDVLLDSQEWIESYSGDAGKVVFLHGGDDWEDLI